MIEVSAIGEAPLSNGLVLGAAVIFWLVRLRLEALFIVGVSVSSGFLNVFFKWLVARPRPVSHLGGKAERGIGATQNVAAPLVGAVGRQL